MHMPLCEPHRQLASNFKSIPNVMAHEAVGVLSWFGLLVAQQQGFSQRGDEFTQCQPCACALLSAGHVWVRGRLCFALHVCLCTSFFRYCGHKGMYSRGPHRINLISGRTYTPRMRGAKGSMHWSSHSSEAKGDATESTYTVPSATVGLPLRWTAGCFINKVCAMHLKGFPEGYCHQKRGMNLT